MGPIAAQISETVSFRIKYPACIDLVLQCSNDEARVPVGTCSGNGTKFTGNFRQINLIRRVDDHST
jgi:hypothetical protein